MPALYFHPTERIDPLTWRVHTIILTIGVYALLFCGGYMLGLSAERDGSYQSPGLVGVPAILRVAAAGPRCLIALQIKRLHGRDKSAGWMLRYLVQFIGGWVMLTNLGSRGVPKDPIVTEPNRTEVVYDVV